MINKLDEIIDKLKGSEKMILSIAQAEDEELLEAVNEAVKENIITPILIGNEESIRAICNKIEFKLDNIKIINSKDIKESSKIAVSLVTNKEADFIMKGIVDTSILLKEVLNKEYGLRNSSLLSHVAIYEIESYHKLLILTDAGMNICPDYKSKEKILLNAIKVAKSLEIENIKIAALAAKEKVDANMQATIDADLLKKNFKESSNKECIVIEGPLSFDIAICKQSSLIKGLNSKVSGDVDILLVPNIEAGNMLGKSFTYMANAKSAGIIMGAKVPIILPSRSDNHQSKLYSIAYGALVSKFMKK